MSTKAPPTTEKAYLVPRDDIPGLGVLGLPDWGTINLDAIEHVPDLKWPNSIFIFDKMRSDPQIEALIRGIVIPIRRFRWEIDPNGSKARVHNRLAEDLGLPVSGKKPRARRRNRFNHDEHLRMALTGGLVYGHQPFEQSGDITIEENRPFWRLRKLLPIMPHTIAEVKLSRDGGMEWIRQRDEMDPPKLTIDRLVWFVHEREGTNWFGRSLLRAAYQPWLLKDRLLRVDAIRHERNGMGVPIVEMPERASDSQRKEAASLAQQYKTGVASGGALPHGMNLRLVGVEGSTSDVLQSIRYHDEAMARLMLQMFAQLGGGGQYGSKALGETFFQQTARAQDVIAEWYAQTMNEYMITDWVDWNYGEEEQPPKLIYKRDEDPELSAHEIAQLVAQGVLTVDTEMENYLRDKYNLPMLKGERPTFVNQLKDAPGQTPPGEGESNDNVGEPPPERVGSET